MVVRRFDSHIQGDLAPGVAEGIEEDRRGDQIGDIASKSLVLIIKAFLHIALNARSRKMRPSQSAVIVVIVEFAEMPIAWDCSDWQHRTVDRT